MSAHQDHHQHHNDPAHGCGGIAFVPVMDTGAGRTTLEMEGMPKTCQTSDPSTLADDRS